MRRAVEAVQGAPAFRPDPPGGPGELDLSSNENLLGPSPKALAALRALSAEVALYPEPWAVELCAALGRAWGTSPESVMAGPGAVSLLDLAARAFLGPGRELVAPHPSFKMFGKMAMLTGARLRQVPLREGFVDLPGLAAAVGPETRLVLVCHPNNPTGTLAEGLEPFLEGLPEHVVAVVDEAYGEFAGLGSPARLLGLDLRCGLLVVRSFSKLYGLAGLRMGAVVGTHGELDALRAAAPPYWTSVAAQAAARAALEDREFVERTLAGVRDGLAVARERAAALGWRLYPSRANFFCVEAPLPPRESGVVVAPCGPLGLPGYVRVAAGSAEAVHRFFDAAIGS